MKKIALVGTAPSSVLLAPFHDPSWTIWTCSPGAIPHLSRVDAHFELHRWEPDKPWFHKEYVTWMAARQCPVYMIEARPEIPPSIAYPKDEILNYVWGRTQRPDGRQIEMKFDPNAFGSSLSWMIALAITQLPDEIGLWGVDMAACTSPETKVLTADLRWVECQDVKVGDKLMAFDEEPVENGNSIKARRWRVADVLEASRLTKPCYRLTLEDGTELVCSDDHKWLTYAENQARWKEAKDLVTPQHREGRPTKIIKLTDVWAEDKSWEAGYLAAAFDGEGHLWQKLRDEDYGVLRCGFAQRDNEMLEAVRAAMKDRGFDLRSTSTEDGMNGDVTKCAVRGGRSKNLEFLGRIRPRRLLGKFNPEHLGKLQKQSTVAVIAAEYIGEQPVIGLRTSTKTFIAEGFASHNTEEYGPQKDGCLNMIQVARNLGIKVITPPESDLLRPTALYGFREVDPMFIKLQTRVVELTDHLNRAEHDYQEANNRRWFFKGALDDAIYVQKTWVADPIQLQRMYDTIDNPLPAAPAVMSALETVEAPKPAEIEPAIPAGKPRRAAKRTMTNGTRHPEEAAR